MMHHPFQIARWALLASFAVMVFVVTFPNPRPSSAWKLAEQSRYDQRHPALPRDSEPKNPPETGFVKRSDVAPKAAERASEGTAENPLRTAHLPARSDSADDLPRGVRIQEPIFFFEDEDPAKSNLAPDPAHLEPPSGEANR